MPTQEPNETNKETAPGATDSDSSPKKGDARIDAQIAELLKEMSKKGVVYKTPPRNQLADAFFCVVGTPIRILVVLIQTAESLFMRMTNPSNVTVNINFKSMTEYILFGR